MNCQMGWEKSVFVRISFACLAKEDDHKINDDHHRSRVQPTLKPHPLTTPCGCGLGMRLYHNSGKLSREKTFVEEVSISQRKLSRDVKPSYRYMHAQNFMEKTFVGSSQTAKIMKV